ncbi:MAG: RNA methyltransferase [candidate division Zixibacteria bacterium]|jgi:TrmH family RNA methyltransferase|nr:RNA methyltransferase [candidate division Zixibacteria bacterium]
MATITGTELKHIKSLLTKKGRKEHAQFVAEGVRVLEEAYRNQASPAAIYYAPSLISDRGEGLVTVFAKRGVVIKELSAQRIQSVTDTMTSQGILAVFPVPDGRFTELCRSSVRKVLLCENIGDPGNLGTLIRSAAAFGFGVVGLLGACAEPFAPKVVRSSAGSIFAVAIAQAGLDEVLGLRQKRQMKLIAADNTGQIDPPSLGDLAARSPFMLAVGSEAEGLSANVLQAADLVVRLEHETAVESLNAAVAGSILMKQIYDFTRERTT